MEHDIGITLFESDGWGGWKYTLDLCPTIRANKQCVGVVIEDENEQRKYPNTDKTC